MNAGQIEVIARGVCIQDGQLLLCHTAGADNTYLPGGHVEFGESAKQALVREINEEMGRESRVTKLLGVVEHAFEQKGEAHCEVNLVFALEVDGVEPGVQPDSCEGHINFLWTEMNDLDASALEPKAVRQLIRDWHAKDDRGGWGSNLED